MSSARKIREEEYNSLKRTIKPVGVVTLDIKIHPRLRNQLLKYYKLQVADEN